MDYDELVAKVIDLLEREQRVPYRALKRRFEIDDEYIEDLKDELIYAKKLAVDEDNRVLVWTGEAEEAPEPGSQPSPTTQPDTQLSQSTQVESPPPIEPHTPDAERRQLTVMFCDLVGSTSLSGTLDPEDLRQIVREYQQVCAEVIQRYDGHVAQLLGDGLLVYFGYPVAHEDDAQRAVRAGLGIVEALGTLNTRLAPVTGITLAVRLGIHTGLVVVGEMGGAGRQEQLALGEVPNVASRLQGLADPDSVVVSEATFHLVEGYFTCQALGSHILKGVADAVPVYRVFQESGALGRLDIVSARGLTPLVGREQETGLLLARWNQVKDGQGQVVLLSGEAGIGKSRLVEYLKDHVADEPHIRWECRSSPYFTNSALYPIIDMVQRTLRFQADDTPEQKVVKLEQNLSQYRLPLEETVSLFSSLLTLPVPEDRYPPLPLSPQMQRQKTLEAMVAITLELSERQPVLFILEDLHWLDPTTLELLDLLLDQTPTASLCVLLTCRPEYQPSWSHRSYLTEMTINRLSQSQVERMAQQVADGKLLPTEVVQQLVDKTDGVPLYVEEMTKSILESGVLKEANGQYELSGPISALSIPATLQDSLMSRLDRLVTAKAVAQYASVIGRQFSYELLQEVSELDEATLQRELRRLVAAELLYQRGLPPQAMYTFKHALIQDTAYESLLRNTRHGYHRRIAEVLQENFPETAESQPELLAHHYTQAGVQEQAVDYWYKAGQKASERSANQEAVAHLTQGLELLGTLPDTTERAQQELVMQTTLAPALRNTKGQAAPEVRETYARAYALCQQVEDAAQLFPILRGLWNYYNNRAEFHAVHELGEQLFALAQRQDDPTQLLWGHCVLGMQDQYYHGAFARARGHFEQAIRLYDPRRQQSLALLYGQDPGVVALSFLAWMLWMLGYPDQSLRKGREALTLAQELAHPYSLAAVLNWVALLHQFRRERQATREQAEAVMAVASEYGFAQRFAWGQIIRGWALAEPGQALEGLEQIRQGLDAFRATGQELWRPYNLALLGEAYEEDGNAENGLRAIDEALALVEATGECFWETELHRLKGQLLLQQAVPDVYEVEVYFHKALDLSQNQQAKSLELRAATSLARLWQSQGKPKEAYDLLVPVYAWFTEGFDTADLIDAKALLDELSEGR